MSSQPALVSGRGASLPPHPDRLRMMPNPLTDELTDDQKAELAAKFAEMKDRCERVWSPPAEFVKPWRELRRGW